MSQRANPHENAAVAAAEEDVIQAVLEMLSAERWAENHPEDPHHGDTLDMANDLFATTLINHRIAVEEAERRARSDA